MPTYTVHAPPPREGETASAPERFRCVRDGFSFWAFLVPPLWLLARRLWLALLIWVVAYGLIEIGLVLLRTTWGIQSLVAFLIGVLTGLEASSIERWTLARRGWKTLGFVVAGDAEMAEQRFFSEWAKESAKRPQPEPARPAVPPEPPAFITPPRQEQPTGNAIIGLFPESGVPR